jgi:hypothetical protein
MNAVKVKRRLPALVPVQVPDRFDQGREHRLIHEEPDHGPQHDGDRCLEKPVPQLLQVIQERHPPLGIRPATHAYCHVVSGAVRRRNVGSVSRAAFGAGGLRVVHNPAFDGVGVCCGLW